MSLRTHVDDLVNQFLFEDLDRIVFDVCGHVHEDLDLDAADVRPRLALGLSHVIAEMPALVFAHSKTTRKPLWHTGSSGWALQGSNL